MKTLYERTLELLNASPLPIREIAEGADLPYDWLVSIKYDRIRNPSVDRVQRLYEYLTNKPLSV